MSLMYSPTTNSDSQLGLGGRGSLLFTIHVFLACVVMIIRGINLKVASDDSMVDENAIFWSC